jgi:hypothetical protein
VEGLGDGETELVNPSMSGKGLALALDCRLYESFNLRRERLSLPAGAAPQEKIVKVVHANARNRGRNLILVNVQFL